MTTSPIDRTSHTTWADKQPSTLISKADLAGVTDAVAAVAPDWTVELSQVFVDEVNLIIMPDRADDNIGPTFVIYQEGAQFHVDEVRWDVCTPIGVFPSLGEASHAMILRLGMLTGVIQMASRRRH